MREDLVNSRSRGGEGAVAATKGGEGLGDAVFCLQERRHGERCSLPPHKHTCHVIIERDGWVAFHGVRGLGSHMGCEGWGPIVFIGCEGWGPIV